MSSDLKVSDAIQTGKAELTRTASPGEVSGPQVIKGHLEPIAKSIFGSSRLSFIPQGTKLVENEEFMNYAGKEEMILTPKLQLRDCHWGSVFTLNRSLFYALQCHLGWY